MIYWSQQMIKLEFVIFVIDWLVFLSIVYNLILQFYRKRFSPEKSPCGKMHTRQNIVKASFFKKRPLRENADTAKNDFLIFSIFSRERNFYVSLMFTSDNYTFHKEKHLFFRQKIFTMC